MTRAQGFTLVELAVGLVIIALLLGMLIVPLGTQMEQQRYGETQRQVDLVREAVLGFAMATGRLPCPATPNTPNTVAGAGTENCALNEGVVAWASLGVPETDAWGRRLTYRVTASFADAPVGGALSSFLLTDNGDITVTNGASNIAMQIPAVVISHGTNGFGAFQPNGAQIGGATGDELENANNNATFVARTSAPDFDDLVAWVSLNVLKTRMVAANRLP